MTKSDVDLLGPRSAPGPSVPCHQAERAACDSGLCCRTGWTGCFYNKEK